MTNDEVPPTPPVIDKKVVDSSTTKLEIPTNFSKADLSNLHFTHYLDRPGLVLISKSLNGDNYSAWKRAMILALNSKNKLGFVNGSIKAPLEETDLEGYVTWS